MRFKKTLLSENCKGCWRLMESWIKLFGSMRQKSKCDLGFQNETLARICPCSTCLVKGICREICEKRRIFPISHRIEK